jgi:uncharacterized OB-fold protein
MHRPVAPASNPNTKIFWDGCRRGEFLLQRCLACGALRHPPSPVCPKCLSPDDEWIKAGGRGQIYTFAVARQPLRRGWEDAVPYVVAVVEIDEGPRVLSNIVNVAPERVRIGMVVELMFEQLEGGGNLPVFQPHSGGGE